MSFVRRHPIATLVIAFILLIAAFSSVRIVPETQQGLVLRFGKPVRVINRYTPGAPFGAGGAGLTAKLPFAEDYVWVDKRIHAVEMQQQQVVSTDQRRLEVDAFANYRVVDPQRMYTVARSQDQVGEALKPILSSALRNELGKRPFASLLSPEREGVMEGIREGLDRTARQYGVEIIDVRIKKADLPDGAPLQSALDQMRTARLQEAQLIRAEGMKQAQIIQAQADADASKIYAASFGKDPEFYDFYRAMQSYRTTFVGDDQNKVAPTTIILSPQSDYLKEFTGR
ncbi:protease modulator HflC [Sphingomonas sp. ASV193]|uniref:protease modulator HflC n=1 Tax=Sphingomonas sp. ASV193 TaxID=3144405 RepID=UPI0032E86B26